MTTRLLALLALVPTIALPQTPKSGLNLYSVADESEIGRRIGQQLRGTLAILDEPGVVLLGTTLAEHADATFVYRFSVFDDAASTLRLPAGEPLVAPGGWIFVPQSVVAQAGGESQLGAILAHAIAHTAMRHATHLMSLRTLAQMGVDALPDKLPAVVPVSASLAIPIALAQNARKCEMQADALALTILSDAGYDPHALIDYIRTLPAEGHLSSMPAPSLRIARIEAALEPKP